MEITQKKNYREIIATDGKYLHRKGSDSYFTKGIILPTDTLEDFEEVDSIPQSEEVIPYKEQVIQKVREKYSIDDELAILRQKDSKPQEFKEYYNYVESVKTEIKSTL